MLQNLIYSYVQQISWIILLPILTRIILVYSINFNTQIIETVSPVLYKNLSFPSMYKTGIIKIKTQILQTILAELPQTAKKIKLSIKFDQQEKLNTFKRLEAERQQDEEQCQRLQSDSQSEHEDALDKDLKEKQTQSFTRQKPDPKYKIPENQVWHQKIDISLEEGIIYKQFYQKEFEKLAELNCVKIKIRAQKITFQGYDIEDIEQVMDDCKALMDTIEVEYIPKYGLEMSESAMINKMLQKIGIKIFRILDKFYRWYEVSSKLSPEQQRQKKNQIKQTLHKIDSAHHCLQNLSTIEKDIDRYKGSINNEFEKLRYKNFKYRPLLQTLKADIFEKQFKGKLNQESTTEEQIEVELGINRNALVFHSVAKELLQMSIKDVKMMYQSYDYFFLTIDYDNPIKQTLKTIKEYEYDTVMEKAKVKSVVGEIEEVKDINYIHFITNYQKVKSSIDKKLNDPDFSGDYVPKQSVVFCIGFKRKGEQKKMMYLCEILEKLQNLWGESSYKISILLEQPEELQDPTFSYEFNANERVFSMVANQAPIETNLMILKEYVIKNKISLNKIKQPNLDSQQNNVSLTVVNRSQLINESSVFHQKSMSQDLNGSRVLDGVIDNNFLPNLQGNQMKEYADQRCLKLLIEYKVYIPETNKEYNEKYKDGSVKQNIVVKTNNRNRSIEDDLIKITDCNFHVFKVQLNPKHKIDSFYQDPAKDQIITVFIPAKVSPFVKPKGTGLNIQEGMYDMFQVSLLGNSKETISENGYLLNVRKRDIVVEGKSFKIIYGQQFEVAKELFYLKK